MNWTAQDSAWDAGIKAACVVLSCICVTRIVGGWGKTVPKATRVTTKFWLWLGGVSLAFSRQASTQASTNRSKEHATKQAKPFIVNNLNNMVVAAVAWPNWSNACRWDLVALLHELCSASLAALLSGKGCWRPPCEFATMQPQNLHLSANLSCFMNRNDRCHGEGCLHASSREKTHTLWICSNCLAKTHWPWRVQVRQNDRLDR